MGELKSVCESERDCVRECVLMRECVWVKVSVSERERV